MIDLTRSDDFTLGPVEVRPSSRELVGSAGVAMIEPKVMQVLVALSRAGGRVVSRDELVETCWQGRIVGDDAINRVIGKLRRVAQDTGGGAFRIETVARTGYRLIADPPAPSPVAAPGAAVSSGRAWWLAPIAAVALGLAVLVPNLRKHDATQPVTRGMPAAVTDLETRGLSSMFENTAEQTAEGVGYLRQATVLAPRAAPVWGSLAMSYVLSLGWASPAERPAVAERVRDAAQRGLALDPRESRSIAALVSLEPSFQHWSAKAAALRTAAVRAHPDTGPLGYQQVQFLIATGHPRAALAAIRPIFAASPLIPWIRASYIDLLAANGRLEEADRAAEEAHKIWPRDRLIWFTRFDLAMFNGQAERALAMAADRSGWPKDASAAEIDLAARTATALRTPTDGNTGPLLQALIAVAPRGHAEAERAVRAAAALDRPDIAMAAARRLLRDRLPAAPRATILPNIGLPADAEPPTAALFLPPASALSKDPAFLALMREAGLVDYWRRTGPPDFCDDEPARSLCRQAGIPARATGRQAAP